MLCGAAHAGLLKSSDNARGAHQESSSRMIIVGVHLPLLSSRHRRCMRARSRWPRFSHMRRLCAHPSRVLCAHTPVDAPAGSRHYCTRLPRCLCTYRRLPTVDMCFVPPRSFRFVFFDGFIYIQHERNRSSVLESNAAPEHACSSGTLSGSGAARGYWNAPTVLGPPRWCWNAPMVLGPPRGPGTPGGAGTLVVLGRGIPVPPGGSSTIGVPEPRFGPWRGGGGSRC